MVLEDFNKCVLHIRSQYPRLELILKDSTGKQIGDSIVLFGKKPTRGWLIDQARAIYDNVKL